MSTSLSTTNGARAANKDALEKDIDLTSLDSFQLPPELTEEFIERAQEETSTILDLVDTVTLDRLEQDVPQLGSDVLSGGHRSEGGSRTETSDVESGEVSFNATDKIYYINVEPKQDAIKNTHYSEDEWGELILSEFRRRWANDVGLLGLNAGYSGATSVSIPTGLQGVWTGWIARAEGDADSDRIGLEDTADAETSSMPVYDHSDGAGDPQAVSTTMFDGTITTLDTRYRNGEYDPVFLLSADNVQAYDSSLIDREDSLGVAVIQGDSDVTPFGYDIVSVPGMPNDVGLFTDPNNLAYGLYGEMDLDQLTESDKIAEQKLHSRNWLEGQFDYQIKEMQAGVLIENIADPTA